MELNSLESKATKLKLYYCLRTVVTFQNLILVLSHIKSRLRTYRYMKLIGSNIPLLQQTHTS